MQTTAFSNKLELLLQQTESRLRSRVDVGTGYVGKMWNPVNQIGILSLSQPGPRYSDIVPTIPNETRRWVFPTDRDVAVLVDTFDELKSTIDIKPGITEATAAAANRFFDDLIIAAAIGSASTGVDASSLSTESFDSTVSTSGGALVADTFGASASTGMTYPKMVEAWRVMRHQGVDLEAEMPTLVYGSQQEADLKKQQEVINKDYNAGMTVESGRVSVVGGFAPVVSERLNTSSSDTLRNCFAFVKSGIHLGIWKDFGVNISQETQRVSQPWQLYAMVSAGATRTQQYKVIQINCADTTSVDPTAP